jgi:hypothetical protein
VIVERNPGYDVDPWADANADARAYWRRIAEAALVVLAPGE